MMNRISLGGLRTFLFTMVSLAGLTFAVLLFAASVSSIGWRPVAAFKYFAVIFALWLTLEACDRFLGAWFRTHEVWIIMAFFLLVYLIGIQLLPELGQRRMPFDSLRAQKSLEAGTIAFFRPLKFYYWINYDALLSVLGIIFKPTLSVGQILNALCRVLVLYPVFRQGERISGYRMARLVTITLAMSPALTLYATTLVGDFLAAMFYLYGIYILVVLSDWKGFSLNNMIIWVGVGGLIGFGYLFKSVSSLFLGAIFVWFVVMAVESRKAKSVLLLGLAFATIWFGQKVVITVRESVVTGMINESELKKLKYEGFLDGILYEMYLGLSVNTDGNYSAVRDRTIRSVDTKKKIQYVKDMLAEGKSRYPAFLTYKFKRIWGTNDSPGSILYWFRTSCQDDCYNPRAQNYCVPWLQTLLGAEHLFVVAMFLAGMCGFVLSIFNARSFTNAQGIGLMSVMVVLAYAAISMMLEAHGRYRTVIYPFFFLVLPYSGVWLKVDNPLYTYICRLVLKIRERMIRHER